MRRMTAIMCRAAINIAIGAAIATAMFLTARPASGRVETLTREAQMAVRHLQSVLPDVLERCDRSMREAIESADRARRGRIRPADSNDVVAETAGRYAYADANAMIDVIMSSEYIVGLCSRRLDLVEDGLCFVAMSEKPEEWKVGDVGLLSLAGEFDRPFDRQVHVIRVLGPSRLLASARLVGIDQTPSGPFVLDGVPTDDLSAGDEVDVGREPFAVVGGQTDISARATQSIPVPRPVGLNRFAGALAEAGQRSVRDYRRAHPRPVDSDSRE